MENASNALLIAGGVLLAILVLSIGVYLVNNLRVTTDSYVQQLDAIELGKYNSNFEVFIGRHDVTAQEIVTTASISRQKGFGTKVIVMTPDEGTKDVTTGTNEQFQDWVNGFLSKYILTHKEGIDDPINQFEYVENPNPYNSDGRFIVITFKKIS